MKQVAKLAVALIPLFVVVGCGTSEEKAGAATETQVSGGSVGSDAGSASGSGSSSTATAKRLAEEAARKAAEAEAASNAQARADAEAAAARAAADAERAAREAYANLLKERKIYFDFDESEVKSDFRDIIAAHAKNLADNPNLSVVIEGHCDERGTREYNMALGERRAHSVAKMLTLLGASQSQVKTVSFGEEKPEVEGHDDSAWKWNRRAVFAYSE